MPRYELVEGTSSKFWEITLDGASFTASWGRIGTRGQSKRQDFVDEPAALVAYEKLVAEKVKKGYQPADGASTPAPARSSARKQLVVRLENNHQWRELILSGAKLLQRHGFIGKPKVEDESAETHPSEAEAKDLLDFLVARYVKSGSKEVSREVREIGELDTPAAVAGRAKSNPALERQCLDHPDDAQKWSMYAEWLQTEGDLHGELAAFRAAGKDTDALRLMSTHAEAFWGELAGKIDTCICDLIARHGFFVGATVKRGGYDSKQKLDELTKQLLALPIARFITALRFGLASYESDNDWTKTLAAVLASKQAPDMKRLAFDDYTSEDCEISWTAFGDFSRIWKGLPKLEHLHIRSGQGGELGTIVHGALKTFIRESGGLSGGELDTIVKAKWPQLERLDLWTGSANYEAEATVDALQPILAAKGLPNLRHLGIINSELGPELIPLLAKSSVLKQLKVLDLSKGVLTDAEAELLLAHRDAFAHLERFDLSENLLEDGLDPLKRGLKNANLDKQRESYGDEDDRYVALGE
jgi:predicted DNA-binding WGR domain protein